MTYPKEPKVEVKEKKMFCYTCGEEKIFLKKGICIKCWKIIDSYAYREILKTELLVRPNGRK